MLRSCLSSASKSPNSPALLSQLASTLPYGVLKVFVESVDLLDITFSQPIASISSSGAPTSSSAVSGSKYVAPSGNMCVNLPLVTSLWLSPDSKSPVSVLIPTNVSSSSSSNDSHGAFDTDTFLRFSPRSGSSADCIARFIAFSFSSSDIEDSSMSPTKS